MLLERKPGAPGQPGVQSSDMPVMVTSEGAKVNQRTTPHGAEADAGRSGTHTLYIQGREPVDFPSYGSADAALNKWARSLGCVAHVGRGESEPFIVRDNAEAVVTRAWIRRRVGVQKR